MSSIPNQKGPWSRGDIRLFSSIIDIMRSRYGVDIGTEEKEVGNDVGDLVEKQT